VGALPDTAPLECHLDKSADLSRECPTSGEECSLAPSEGEGGPTPGNQGRGENNVAGFRVCMRLDDAALPIDLGGVEIHTSEQ